MHMWYHRSAPRRHQPPADTNPIGRRRPAEARRPTPTIQPHRPPPPRREARRPRRAAAGQPARGRSCAHGGARASRSASPGKLGARRACAAEARARQSPAHPDRAQLTRATHATLRTTRCARRAADGAQRAPDRAASTGPARRRARRPESCRGDALGADLLNGVGAPRAVS